MSKEKQQPINYGKIIDEMFQFKQTMAVCEEEYNKRREILRKAFDNTAVNTLSSDTHTATCKKGLNITYDLEKIEQADILAEVKTQLVQKTIVVEDYAGLVELMRSAGIKPSQFKPLIRVDKQVDGEAIKRLFDTRQITLDDIKGCYHAQITKTITIR